MDTAIKAALEELADYEQRREAPVLALNLPLVLTRRMEHHVRHAPDHYSATQALRYGEIRGLGGSEELAREVAVGRLGGRSNILISGVRS